MNRAIGFFFLLLLGGILAGCQRPAPPRLLLDGASFVLRGTWEADLDTAKEEASAKSDVWWAQVSDTERYWVPRNGARFAAMGTGEPTAALCRQTALSEEPIDGSVGPTNRIPTGSFLCARTAEGHLAIVKVENYDWALTLRVWVWDR